MNLDARSTPAASAKETLHNRTDERPPHVVIRASAGTGKTFQLSNRFLQLILLGHSAERILATTFTRKAAGEILDRILFRLAQAAHHPEQTSRLATELGLPGLSISDCRKSLQDLTSRLHRLQVSTLDSFFLRAAQTFSLELGLPPRWQVLEEREQLLLRDQAIARLLEDDSPEILLQLLHWLTKGTTQRSVHRLLSDTVANMYELYLESPAEAWRRLRLLKGCTTEELDELAEQLRRWIDLAEPAEPRPKTAVDKRLRNAVASLLEDLSAQRWDSMLSRGLVKKIMEGDAKYHGKELPDDLLRIVDPIAGHVRAEIQNRLARQTEASYDVLHRFHQHFENLKLERRAMQFNDVPRHLGTLEEKAHLSQLTYRLDATVDALLLDEFQDTSLDQWRVVRPFAKYTSSVDAQRSFLCVGDTKQAIYGWRGGNSELLDAVAAELDNLTSQSLDCSFRSAPAVIDAVNQINTRMHLHDNLDRYETAIRSWVDNYPEHTTRRQDLPGYVSLETTDAAAKQDACRELAVRQAADRVLELRAAAPHLSVAILVRTNEWVGRTMYELQKRGILASEEGGNPLTDSAGVQLILSLLTLADHSQDTAARFHLATSPWSAALELTDLRNDQDARRLANRVHRQLAEQGFGRLVDTWVRQLKSFCNAREWRRLNQLVELAYRYQQQVETPRDVAYSRQHVMPISTAEFVARVKQQRISDPTEDPVRVMNVHQSKGLQFDVVILPDLDRKLLSQTPTYAVDRPRATEPLETVVRYASQDIRALLPRQIQRVHDRDQTLRVREELSVLYVALTRAVHSLQMIIAPSDAEFRSDDEPAGRRRTKAAEPPRLPRTVSGLIRAALTDHQPLGPRQRVYEHGDPNWIEKLPDRRQPEPPARLVGTPFVRLRPAAKGASSTTDRVVRPSQLEGAGRVRISDQLNPPGQVARQRGSLVHAFLEQVQWADESLPTVDQLVAIGRSLDANDDHLRSAIDTFEEMISRPAVREILSRTRYGDWFVQFAHFDQNDLRLDVRTEQRLTAREGDEWMSGSIDRLVMLRHQGRPIAAEILDFKTDALPHADSIAERVAYYQPQLAAYRRGASRMLRLETQHITTGLLFVPSGQLALVSG